MECSVGLCVSTDAGHGANVLADNRSFHALQGAAFFSDWPFTAACELFRLSPRFSFLVAGARRRVFPDADYIPVSKSANRDFCTAGF